MSDQTPARLTDRVDRLAYLRDLRAELLRSDIAITPGIERYLSEVWEYRISASATNAPLTPQTRPCGNPYLKGTPVHAGRKVPAQVRFSTLNQDGKN